MCNLQKLALVPFVLAVTLLIPLLGCEDDPPDAIISQFDRPQDVAFVCYDDDKDQPIPLECCKKKETLAPEICGTTISTGKLYAFVTQTTPGEVAVVDVEAQVIVDQDLRIPYNSFVPVGGQPNDIAATDDGKRVYTANFETGDLSVIHVVNEVTGVSVINTPYLAPAASINLNGAAARIAIVKSPERYKDRFALVTQPFQGRLAVIALDPDPSDCPAGTTNPEGCVLAHLPLNELPDFMEDQEVHPWAITRGDGQSVYVSSFDGEVIWDIQTESLVAEALNVASSSGVIDPARVLNDIIPITPHRARALSLEPKRKRWLYAIDNEGGVIAINLKSREAGSKEPPKINPVDVPGRARSVVLVEPEEDGDPGPLTFNGTFALVSTTMAGIAVIDVDDNNADPWYTHPHSIRSAVDLQSDGGVPNIEEEPILTVDGEEIPSAEMGQYVYFDTSEVPDAGCDAGADYRDEFEHGIQLRCDPRESRAETWTLTWQGLVGIAGVGTVTNIQDYKGGPYSLLSEDWDRDFCEQELYPKGSREGYPGDLLIITSDPTPDVGSEDRCKEMYDVEDQELIYRVTGVTRYYEDNKDDPANVIEFEGEGNNAVPLLSECFGQALSFEVRADDHWILKGSSSSFKRTAGKLPPDENRCEYDTDKPSKMRVYDGETLDNSLIRFNMRYGEEWADAGPSKIEEYMNDDEDPDEDPEVSVKFDIVGGYIEMYTVAIGNNITDMELTPDNDLVLIDQASEGLIVFDVIDGFKIIGHPIN